MALPNLALSFNWSSIEPSWDLKYTPCFQGLQCARLLMPLDWSLHSSTDTYTGTEIDHDDTNTISIAIAMTPANVDRTSSDYGGTMIWNPGGPGIDTVHDAQSWNLAWQQIVNGKKKFDIMAFDSRGIGESHPRFECYDDAVTRNSKLAEHNLINPDVLGDREAFQARKAWWIELGQRCSRKGHDGVGQHMNTASAARDLLQLVDKIDEHDREQYPDITREQTELPKIQYLGASYGTYLGTVFISMFPGRVGRMLLDAVDNRQGDTMIFDADFTRTRIPVDHVWEVCFELGCALRDPSDNGPYDMKKRITEYFDRLDKSPVLVEYKGVETYINSFTMRGLFFDMAARPDSITIMSATNGIAAAHSGNYRLYMDYLDQLSIPFLDRAEAIVAIRCLDASGRQEEDPDALLEAQIQQALGAGNSVIDPYIAIEAFVCQGWTLEPSYRFTGKMGSPRPYRQLAKRHILSEPNLVNKRPAAPVFITSSRHDPMTSLNNSVMATYMHEGSSIVIQENYGHAALRDAGPCLKAAIQEYFAFGVVPKNGTVCPMGYVY